MPDDVCLFLLGYGDIDVGLLKQKKPQSLFVSASKLASCSLRNRIPQDMNQMRSYAGFWWDHD